MENRSHALLAGAFTLALLGLLVVALYWFNLDRTERTPYDIVTTGSVSGLNPQAAVRYRGLLVGKVDSIRFDDRASGLLVVRVKLDKGTPVTSRTVASLAYQGLTGLAYVQLDDKPPANAADAPPVPLASTDKRIARIPMQPGLMERLEKRGEALLDQVAGITSSANEVLVQLGDLTRSANTMLGPDNRAMINGTLRSISNASTDFAKLARALEPAAERIPQLVSGAERIGTQLEELSSSLQQSAVVFNDVLGPQINGVGQDLRNTARSATRAFSLLSAQPQSVLFGAPAPAPGPGETGFVPPPAAAAAGRQP